MENSNAVLEAAIHIIAETEIRPQLDSFDSGQEFSLTRLMEVYQKVQIEDHELDGLLFDDRWH